MELSNKGLIEGHIVGFYIGGNLIAASLTKDFKRSMATRSVNNDDTGDDEVVAPGRRNTSLSGRSHFQFDANYGYRDLHDAINARTEIVAKVATGLVGDFVYSVKGYLTQLDATFPDHENAEYDWAFQSNNQVEESQTLLLVNYSAGQVTLSVTLPAGQSVELYWGDGTSVPLSPGVNNVSSDYSEEGKYHISVSGDYLEITAITAEVAAGGSTITGDISRWITLIDLTTMDLSGNDLSFGDDAPWLLHDHDIDLSSCGLTSVEIDNILIALSGGDFSTRLINVAGSNEARTSASDAAIILLETAGNTVMVNE